MFSEIEANSLISEITLENQDEVLKNVERLKEVVNFDCINELGLQCMCVFLFYSAFDFCKTLQLKININGGKMYHLPDILSITATLKKQQEYFISDLDFTIADQRVLEKLEKSNVVPYFGVYELKKKTIAPRQSKSMRKSIEKHPDFCKMACLLRCMMKNYSSLQISHAELKKIAVWGIIQSSTQIWFLRCKAAVHENKSSAYSIIYEITCSKEMNILEHYEAICRLYCRMMKDAADLSKILLDFTITDTYMDTDLTKRTNTAELKAYYSHDFEYADLEKEGFSGIQQVDLCDGELCKLTRDRVSKYITQQCSCFYVSETIISSKYTEFSKFVFRQYGAQLYIYESSSKLIQITNLNSCRTFFVFFKIAEVEQCVVLRYSKVPDLKNKDISNSDGNDSKHSTLSKSDDDSDNRKGRDPNNDSSLFNSTSLFKVEKDNTSAERRDNKEAVLQLDTSEVKTTQEQLNTVLQWYRSNSCSSNYTFENISISDRSIYCTILNHKTKSATFLKLADASKSTEAISIMKRFANQQLSNKYINKIESYKIVRKYNHKWNVSEGFITITESEHLESLGFAMNRMGFRSKSSVGDVIDWIVNDIILSSLSGLEYLHLEGIIHGDLSFGNFMFKNETVNELNEKSKWIAVICDLNECFWMQDEEKIRSRRYCFGKDEYLIEGDCLASVQSDCYAWMVSICKMIFYIVFGRRDNSKSSEGHKQLTMIFDTNNWSRFQVNCVTTLAQILKHWNQIFEMVVTQKCKMTCNQLRHLFTKQRSVVSKQVSIVTEGKENFDPVSLSFVPHEILNQKG